MGNLDDEARDMEREKRLAAADAGRAARPTWLGRGRRLAVRLGGMYGVVLVVLLLLENRLIYPAPRYPHGDWQPVALEYEDVYFESADGTRLHGWFLAHPRPRAFLLFCHGNGEHVAYAADTAAELRARLDVAVLVFDYRGYGRSEGSPHEAGILQDGEAAHAWLAARAQQARGELVLMGRSLGGAVAIDLAARHGARGLVAQSTFTSLPDAAARLYWWAPVRLLMRNRLQSIGKIPQYSGPLLLGHGTADELVPLEHSQMLLEAAGSQNKQLVAFPGRGHNDPAPPEFLDAIDRLLGDAVGP